MAKAVFDAVGHADSVEDAREGIAVALVVADLDAIVGEDRVDMYGTAAMRLRRNWVACILPAEGCNSA